MPLSLGAPSEILERVCVWRWLLRRNEQLKAGLLGSKDQVLKRTCEALLPGHHQLQRAPRLRAPSARLG